MPSRVWDRAFSILIVFALAIVTAVVRASAAPDIESSAPGTSPDSASDTQGFEHPVAIIPEMGLWVDGIAELGYAKKTGLVLWWNLEKERVTAHNSRVDWSRVSFRVRASVYDTTGKQVEKEERLVDPLQTGLEGEHGGFPAPIRIPLKAGVYRVHLEAYPLISASAAGLDSVPRGVADATAIIPELSHRRVGWSIGDPLFLESAKKWEPGSSDDRTWYDWTVHPNPSRTLSTHGKTGQLAFEVVRSFESVPRCGANTCRVVITVNDAAGGIVLQELRPVPEPATSSAYLVPLDASGLTPGRYSVTIEIFEAKEREAAIRREFSISS
ncbi:MAG TPA: hypothetical protein VGR66_07380 [Candidatus Eisenbacteria bacterium]|nr:hypothetical protein [Candidatus Eisenbacteria bacterium]